MSYTAVWDKLGMTGSALCLLHCLALPLAAGALPSLGVAFLADEAVHEILAFLLIALAGLAFVPGFRRHRDARVLGLMAIGLGLILFATWSGAFIDFSEEMEVVISVMGSLFLISAHYLNHSFCRACSVSDAKLAE
jgi:hypothetical protein